MSREVKPQIYYYIRKGWNDQLASFCDSVMARKGKDPVAMFWKAFALGMAGAIPDCIQQLEAFASRKDMQYPVTLALIYFHKRAARVDREVVDTLSMELSIAEDVTKDAGLLLAARFSLFTGDLHNCCRLSAKVLSKLTRGRADLHHTDIPEINPQTPVETEACIVFLWAVLANTPESGSGISKKDYRKSLLSIEAFAGRSSDSAPDPDLFMVLALSKIRMGQSTDAMNTYSQCIAACPTFAAALTEKALLLAGMNDWEQCLDIAQRAMDMPVEQGGGQDNLDALKCIAVHAFTQEAQPQDALSKLEDLEKVLSEKEPRAGHLNSEFGILFARVCCRQPRAL